MANGTGCGVIVKRGKAYGVSVFRPWDEAEALGWDIQDDGGGAAGRA